LQARNILQASIAGKKYPSNLNMSFAAELISKRVDLYESRETVKRALKRNGIGTDVA
jgi:hypothetical protein